MNSELLTLDEFRSKLGNLRVFYDTLTSPHQSSFLKSLRNNNFKLVFSNTFFSIENIDKSNYNEYFYYSIENAEKKITILNQQYLPQIEKNVFYLLKRNLILN